MTVCIAALFRWNYALGDQPDDWGSAAITVSDRMITAGDFQYEPNQQKLAILSDQATLLIAGDYAVHSQALKTVQTQLKSRIVSTYDVALMYGAAIQAIQRKAAEDIILAPLGLNTDSFLAQQKDMSDNFVASVTSQLQNYRGAETQAIIVGMTNGVSHLYEIDQYGSVGCYDDVGFAAIGIGSSHARSVLMQSGYVNSWKFAFALSLVFAAKKAAETAPGVGKVTDITLILRTGRTPLTDEMFQRLIVAYDEYEKKRAALALEAIKKLGNPLDAPESTQQTTGDTGQGNSSEPGQGAVEGAKNTTDSAE